MWPLISSSRISSACAAASSGVSANFTPPAFMRPPVSTCDLMTVGAPISCAMRLASSAEVAKPCGDVGMPALATIFGIRIRRTSWGAAAYPGAACASPSPLSGAPRSRAAPPPRTSRSPSPRDSGGAVRHAAPAERQPRDGTTPAGRPAGRAAGPPVPLQGRVPDDGHGDHARRRRLRLRAPLRPQHGRCGRSHRRQARASRGRCAPTSTPGRARSFKALSRSRLRITQFLRTPAERAPDGQHDLLPRPQEREVGAAAWPAPSRAGSAAGASRRPRPSSSRAAWKGAFRYGELLPLLRGQRHGRSRRGVPEALPLLSGERRGDLRDHERRLVDRLQRGEAAGGEAPAAGTAPCGDRGRGPRASCGRRSR